MPPLIMPRIGSCLPHSAECCSRACDREPPPAKPRGHRSGSAVEENVADRFMLDIDGTPAIEFGASCRVAARGEGEQKFEFAGLVPDQAVVEARAISRAVRKAYASGRLRTTLLVAEVPVAPRRREARSVWVRMRSDGPWGPAIRRICSLDAPEGDTSVARKDDHPPMRDPGHIALRNILGVADLANRGVASARGRAPHPRGRPPARCSPGRCRSRSAIASRVTW